MTSLTPLSPVEHRTGNVTIRYTPKGCSECGCGPVTKVSIRKITHDVHSDTSELIAVLEGDAAESLWIIVRSWLSKATLPHWHGGHILPTHFGTPRQVTSLTSTDEGPE